MNRKIVIAIILTVVLSMTVSGAYAFNATYNDSFNQEDVDEKMTVLLSKNYNGTITVDDGRILFGSSSDTLSMNYFDSNGLDCYLSVTFTGMCSGNKISVTITQIQENGTFTISGTGMADSEGNATVNGLGKIKSGTSPNQVTGNFTVSATIIGTEIEGSPYSINISAYPSE